MSGVDFSEFILVVPPQFFRCAFEWNRVSVSFLILVCERLEDSHCQFFGFAPNLCLHVLSRLSSLNIDLDKIIFIWNL